MNPILVGKICSIRDDYVSEYCQNYGDVGDRGGIIQDLCNPIHRVDRLAQLHRSYQSLVDHLNWTNQAKRSPGGYCLGGIIR